MRLLPPLSATGSTPGEVLAGGRWPRVAVVVLNWNGKQVLEDCLRSLAQLRYPALEIIVVDNGSDDGSAEIVRANFPHCLLMENKINVGFSAGNNQGIRMSLSRGNDYVMVLNNDTTLDPDCLGWLVQRAESDPQIGAVSPKIYFADRPDRIWFAGGTFNFWKGRNGHVGYRRPDRPEWNVPRETAFLSGCALLVPRHVWQEVGGFDESLFWSAEDVDWSLRAREAGYRLFYAPRAIVWHHESYSILRNQGHAAKMYFYSRNGLAVMWKHCRWWHLFTALPYHIVLSGRRILASAGRRDWPSVVAILRGAKDFPKLARKFCQNTNELRPLLEASPRPETEEGLRASDR